MSLIIVIVTCIISYLSFNNRALFERLSHHPYVEVREGQYERLLTSGFVHGSWGHLGINMFVLYQFGAIVEAYFLQMYGATKGYVIFLVFYLSAIVIANLGTFFKQSDQPGFRSVGASGVTSALVFIYAFFDPWQMFLFPPVPAIIFAVLYVLYSSWASNKNRDNIDHLAHLYGGLYGILFIVITFPRGIEIFVTRLSEGWPF